MFEIESGIDIPAPRRSPGAGRGLKYPFDKMDVGDSFFIPIEAEDPDSFNKEAKRIASNLSGAAQRYRHSHDEHFRGTARVVDGGVRYWRIEDNTATQEELPGQEETHGGLDTDGLGDD